MGSSADTQTLDSTAYAAEVRRYAHRLADDGLAALTGLFDLTAPRLVRYATTVAGNQHDAEDAVQAALAKVASRPRQLRAARQPWPYLLQMVRNEVLLAIRKQKRQTFLPDLRDLLTRCPVDELEQEETYRAIWTALRRIPSEQSEVVVLKIWEEFTYVQIAELLGISPDTAASRYRYAMVKLERLLSVGRAAVHHGGPTRG